MKKAFLFILSLAFCSQLFAQTYYYVRTKDYDQNNIPKAGNGRGFYYTFTANGLMYESDENGIQIEKGAVWQFDGVRDDEGNMHYAPINDSPGFVININGHFNGHMLVAPDKSILMNYGTFIQRYNNDKCSIYERRDPKKHAQSKLPQMRR